MNNNNNNRDDWQEFLEFLQRKIARAEQKGAPEFMVAALRGLYYASQSCWTFEKYLENPRNRGLSTCQWCKKEFKPSASWIVTCSVNCEEQWREFPPLVDRNIVERACYEIQRLDDAERARP